MASPTESLDTAILDHLRQHPKDHPMSSPQICKLAALTEPRRLPYRIIQSRMSSLRKAGRYEWSPSGARYVVK